MEEALRRTNSSKMPGLLDALLVDTRKLNLWNEVLNVVSESEHKKVYCATLKQAKIIDQYFLNCQTEQFLLGNEQLKLLAKIGLIDDIKDYVEGNISNPEWLVRASIAKSLIALSSIFQSDQAFKLYKILLLDPYGEVRKLAWLQFCDGNICGQYPQEFFEIFMESIFGFPADDSKAILMVKYRILSFLTDEQISQFMGTFSSNLQTHSMDHARISLCIHFIQVFTSSNLIVKLALLDLCSTVNNELELAFVS